MSDSSASEPELDLDSSLQILGEYYKRRPELWSSLNGEYLLACTCHVVSLGSLSLLRQECFHYVSTKQSDISMLLVGFNSVFSYGEFQWSNGGTRLPAVPATAICRYRWSRHVLSLHHTHDLPKSEAFGLRCPARSSTSGFDL